MTSMEPSDNEIEALAKKYTNIDAMKYNSVEKYKIISFDIKPSQNPSQEFCDMIALAAVMFNKMEKQDAAQRNYKAACNPSMN